MKFEKLVSQFLKSFENLEKRGRGLHNADFVNLIWKKMMNPELIQYVTTLKVHIQRLPRPYQKVLQDIASQVPLLATTIFCQTPEISTMLDNATEVNCPKIGAQDVEGKLFICKYPFKKWTDELVIPHWDEIRAARNTKRSCG